MIRENISVIIPNYNHGSYLPQRIDSVLSQDYTDIEVIILDDCSADNSKEVIERYRTHPAVSNIVYNEKNSGSPFVQWEKGISLASGDWIWIAESDDWAAPHFLSSLIKLAKEASAGLVYANSQVVDTSGAALHTYFHPQGTNRDGRFREDFSMQGLQFIRNYLLNSNTIPNASAVVFQKKLFQNIEGDYKKYKINGDWLFWVQLLKNCIMAYTSQPLNFFRTHGSNVRSATYQNGTFLPEFFSIQKYLADLLELNVEERRTLKYNMLNRLYTELQVQGIDLSPAAKKQCLSLVNDVSNGVTIPALKTQLVLKLNQWKRQATKN